MAQRGQPLSIEATQSLEEAIAAWFDLKERCPVHLRKPVTDRLLDHVYLLRRKADLQFWRDFMGWLREKYQTLDKLNAECGTAFDGWERIRKKNNVKLEEDFTEFRGARKALGQVVPDVDVIDPDE
jgi:hypothetical protein